MIITNPDRTNALIDALTTLWEASVRATHHFLTEDDIQKLTPFVKMGLLGIGVLVVARDNQNPIAFMGIEADKIEMLFVSPDYFGKELGRAWYCAIRCTICGCERAKSASHRVLHPYWIQSV